MMKTIIAIIGMMQVVAFAGPSTLDVKKRGEQEIKQIVQPILTQYCHEQCEIIGASTEVDVAVQDEATPGFEDNVGKATLTPVSGKVQILVDKFLSDTKRKQVTDLIAEHLKQLDYRVEIESTIKEFPQPAASGYRVAELREKVTRDIKASMQSLINQFCADSCILGQFDVQTEVVNADEVNYGSSQDYFQDGPAAIRVRNVKATVMVDQSLPKEEAAGIVEMAKVKLSQYKNAQVTSEVMNFPKTSSMLAKNGIYGNGRYPAGVDGKNSETSESKDSKLDAKSDSKYDSKTDSKYDAKTDSKYQSLTDAKEQTTRSDARSESLKKNETNSNSNSNNNTENKSEKFERFEKIERVENGDAVQQVLEKFRVYGIILSAIMLALLFSLVAISFRRNNWGGAKATDQAHSPKAEQGSKGAPSAESGVLTSDEKSALIGKRIEADRLFNDLTQIFSEQPKVAKYVFTHVLTEEGVETTAQYLEIFGETVIMDLLRDPGLQSDLSELMDFYAKNTFDINDDETLMLLKKLHHRTVTAKMQVHGSRSAVLFDFLADMDTPQIFEMIKNESNTVKAIVLTQCDQKKRQAIFASYDDHNRLKLMTELSRIDHLPKNYIFNVASALRRKKAENPKLNTEALPGTDVLVSFLEKASVDTQRTIIHQLMSSAGGDVLNNLKAKLASVETLRFVKDAQLTEVITHVKHDELLQFLQGCSKDVRESVLSKAPQDLAADLSDGLQLSEPVNRDTYIAVERKIINRIKVLANQGQISLTEVNERMFAEEFGFNHSNPDVTEVGYGKVG